MPQMSSKLQNSPFKNEIAEVWKLFKEARLQMQEERREAKRQRQEEQKEAKRQRQEEQKESKARKKEIDCLMKDNAIEMKKIQQSLKEAKELFTGQWGALIESLVEGRLLNLLQKRGIDVQRTAQREEGLMVYKNKKGQRCEKRCEIDITAKNGTDVVAVEVKTTLTARGVKRFLEVLKELKRYFPEFKGKKVYGALAFLRHRGEALNLSEESGLFLIKATGDSASIINKTHFKPKVFS